VVKEVEGLATQFADGSLVITPTEDDARNGS
jgi:hypothetical protein